MEGQPGEGGVGRGGASAQGPSPEGSSSLLPAGQKPSRARPQLQFQELSRGRQPCSFPTNQSATWRLARSLGAEGAVFGAQKGAGGAGQTQRGGGALSWEIQPVLGDRHPPAEAIGACPYSAPPLHLQSLPQGLPFARPGVPQRRQWASCSLWRHWGVSGTSLATPSFLQPSPSLL